MSRAVYIGGFSGGEAYAGEVKEALGNHFEDVDSFSFPEAMADPESIRKATERMTVITHSAGMLALHDAVRPAELHAFGAPLPANRMQLIMRTFAKSNQMIGRIRSLADAKAVAKFHARSGAELFLPTRALGHWKPFFAGDISRFDSLVAGEGIASQSARVELNYGDADRYFTVPEDVRVRASKIPGVTLSMLPGQTHDDFVMRPDEVLSDYLSKQK